MAYNDYNPYSDVLGIYNAKVGYNKATTDEERKRQNEIATAARKNLEAYGYEDVAKQLSATGADATAARKIMEKIKEQYAPPETVTTKNTKYASNTLDTGIDNEAYNNRVSSASTKNDIYFNTVQNDHSNVNDKYQGLYDYANSDITQTDEYKSAFKNIMPEYNLKAMQGRDNAVASGGASNGGNIDSFAAANALRQQTAITAKGQALAHQMGLEAANSRVNNVNNILSNLGVYNSSVYSAMSDNINNDRNIYNDITNNEQTALNNETARLSEQANVTGYVPNEWTIKNDAVYNEFLNPDGTFKTEKEGVDIQALINQTTDPATKQKLAVVRAKKALGNLNKYGQYLNQGDIAFMENQKTEAADQFDKNDATVRETLKTESADTRYGVDAEKQMAADANQNAIDQIKAQTEAEKDLLEFSAKLSGNTGTKLSEDGADVFKQVSKNINQNIVQEYGEKYGLADDYEIIQWNGGSDYKLNLPKGHVDSWWKMQIIRPIIESSLTEDDQIAVLTSLFGDNAADYYKEVYTSMQKYGLIK